MTLDAASVAIGASLALLAVAALRQVRRYLAEKGLGE